MRRSDFYKFLSSVYNAPPTEELVTLLYSAGTVNSLLLLCKEAKDYLKSCGPYSEIVQDFHDLMMVPGWKYCTPYEAVYIDTRIVGDKIASNLLMGPSTTAVQKFYQKAGFEISNQYKELPDYIGLELEFMAMLCADEENSDEFAQSFLMLQGQFLTEHISRWIKPFCNKLKLNAQTNVYKAIALITDSFIEDELLYLRGVAE